MNKIKMLGLIILLNILVGCQSISAEVEPTYDIGGLYYGGGKIQVYLTGNAKLDEKNAQHELGHLSWEILEMDDRIDEFAAVVDAYIEANEKPTMQCHREMVCILQRYPGLNENPMIEISHTLEDGTIITKEWGGYVEAYADIYAQWKIGWSELPEEFYPFYNVLPWEGECP